MLAWWLDFGWARTRDFWMKLCMRYDTIRYSVLNLRLKTYRAIISAIYYYRPTASSMRLYVADNTVLVKSFKLLLSFQMLIVLGFRSGHSDTTPEIFTRISVSCAYVQLWLTPRDCWENRRNRQTRRQLANQIETRENCSVDVAIL